MTRDGFVIVTVTLEDRDDDGLRVFSADLPNLVLSGPDKDAVVKCIIPAIKKIFERKGLGDVGVYCATDPGEVLKLRSPRQVDMHVQRFVVELKQAA